MKIKICSKCKQELPETEFSKGNGRKGLKNWCDECINKFYEIKEDRDMVIPIDIMKIMGSTIMRYDLKDVKKLKEEIREYNKEYRKKHPEVYKKWKQTPNGKRSLFIIDTKRRGLGYIILNPENIKKGMVGHHINNKHVVYIPEELHKKYTYPNRETHRRLVMEDPICKEIIENAINNYQKMDGWF